ncbi:hypothetical protein [Halobiforma nitratireducens]|uniref:DUF8119 domain-containing protein n=1 Tax=Halobiforma nitratireducens JCM 10879 TaxID=1227454 RepID=M0LBS3_9EURY|nr:hypothetical protein [Halobiforma nitratireducens]EMA30563.1 hypothetical protein C446_16677 [Halobiforma nitratireducens JCM 10879]
MSAKASRLPDRERTTTLLVDVAVIVAWIVAATVAFWLFEWPVTSYYIVVFGGVIGYSLVADPGDWTGR